METAVVFEQRIARLAPSRRNPIPWQSRPKVVDEVQIVIEEEQIEREAAFNDRGPVLRPDGVTVLGEGAQHPKAEPGVDHEANVLPKWHSRNLVDPEQEEGDADYLPRPSG